MIWFVLVLVAVAVLAPMIGADTRDGRDWQRHEPSAEEGSLRTADDRVRVPAARERVAAHRPTAATG